MIYFSGAHHLFRGRIIRRQKESRSPSSLDEQFLGGGAGGGGDVEEVGAGREGADVEINDG